MYLIILQIVLFFIFEKSAFGQNAKLIELFPNTQLDIPKIKLNEERLFTLKIKNLLPNQHYKVMVHYIGALGIKFEIKIICDAIHNIKTGNNDIKLNDFSEFDFKTKANSIPNICGDEYNKDKVLLSITPIATTYHLIPEDKMEINAILEITQSKLNTDVKFLNILTNKNLYRGIIIALIVIPLLICIFQTKIKKYLIKALGIKIAKDK